MWLSSDKKLILLEEVVVRKEHKETYAHVQKPLDLAVWQTTPT